MSDAQRERTPRDEKAHDSSGVAAGHAASGGEGYEAGPDHESDDRMDSDRVLSARGGSEEGPIAIRVVGRTDVGLVREHNEDNYLLADLGTGSRDPATFREVTPAGLMMAVCDGMGGAAAGEVASQMAVDTIYEMMRKAAPCADRDAFARSLVRAVEEAGTRIFEAARADRSRRGMGTTATVAALMDKILFVGQVGDSRAYVLRGGELKQITKDQSLVNQLIEAGQLTEDEAEAFEHSNIILQALGTTEQVSVDLTFLELRQGDRLLMCSDGLSGLVHGDVIREVMMEQGDLALCCERLIELAKAGGGHDNVTVLLAEFSGAGLSRVDSNDLFGYQQYPLPLDQERWVDSVTSVGDAPTVTPPSLRAAPPPDDLELPRESRAHPPASSSTGRLFLLAMLVIGGSAAIYYWMSARHRGLSSSDGPQAMAPIPPEERAPARVEVLVRTDVEGAELLVDGESYGSGNAGNWTLELPPGPHRLEARAGGSVVTSSLITLKEGSPENVQLSMPAGASLALGDAGAQGAHDSPKNRRRDRALLAEDASDRRSRRARERAAAAEAALAATDAHSAAARDGGPVREPALRELPREVPREVPRNVTSARDAASASAVRDAGSPREAAPRPSSAPREAAPATTPRPSERDTLPR